MKNNRSSMRRAKRLLRVAAFGTGCLLSVVAIADERFTLSSPGLTDNATLDSRHAASAQDCGGKNISLPLTWSNAPSDAKSFAITIYDPDGARGLGIVHWILYGIPATTTALGEGGPPPAGSIGGINRTGKDGYYGPCPPHGDAPHHYVVQAYALDLAANALPAALDRDALIAAMKGHVLASSSMVGRYAR
ncbi:YbhB/YbcL family Raf kinase inhibitor-like protein [Caballeronia sp. 15715]|uniref:YbhB/YbcL family Raf kinase inhibitor-like protein n=1 Tax=Caballeronia sp. 15715 TaxID=3391030 RepID=UPI0039E2A677